LSTAEAEYMAAMHAAKEAIWLCKLIFELFPMPTVPTPLYCDNQAALALATADNYHTCTKHINIRYHFICNVVIKGSINLIYCTTEEMTADTLTKPLPKWKMTSHNLSLGLYHICGGVAELVLPKAEKGYHSNVEHPEAQGLAFASPA